MMKRKLPKPIDVLIILAIFLPCFFDLFWAIWVAFILIAVRTAECKADKNEA